MKETDGKPERNRSRRDDVWLDRGESVLPTGRECEEFNRRAREWLAKRGQRTGFDGLEFQADDHQDDSCD